MGHAQGNRQTPRHATHRYTQCGHDLHTTVSGVQSAIALEALVSAAFILIGSKVGDLIGRKRAYVLGLLGYGIGALAMALAQGLTAIIVFWAIVGGIGASLLLPAMQSLIHGNVRRRHPAAALSIGFTSMAHSSTVLSGPSSSRWPRSSSMTPKW
jgi:MFS family permease